MNDAEAWKFLGRKQRIWALPFLTVLAPSERYSQQYKLRHKKLIDWARQMIFQVKRWLPTRELVVVAHSSFAALELLAAVSQAVMPVHIITRLRLDAALYEPTPEITSNTMGRPRLKGARLPNLQQGYLFCQFIVIINTYFIYY